MRQDRRHSTISHRKSEGCCQPLRYEFHTTEEYDVMPVRTLPPLALVQGLVAHTTSHGIPHIDNARGVVKKTVWSVITLLMVLCLIANLVLIITTYLRFKVDIIIQMQHQRELDFPAVSVCNMNPVKASMVAAVPEIQDLIYGDMYNTSMEGQPVQDSAYPERTHPRLSFLREEKLAELLAGLNATWQLGIGHLARDMILDCQYAGYQCYDFRDFQHYYNTILGNCYVFNSGWHAEAIKPALKTGRRYGLKLIINIEQDEYLPELTDAAGVRVVIHPQERMPFPQDEGIVAAPGLLTSVGIRQLTINRKGDEYGNCTRVDMESKNVTRNVFEEHFDVSYSSRACYRTCYQRHLVSVCECGDAQFPLSGRALGSKTYPVCDSLNVVQDDCKYNTSSYFNNALIECEECVLPCHEKSFSPEISSVQWPSDVYEASLLRKYDAQLDKIVTDSADPEKYKRNLLKLEVFYEEFNYEYINERASYTEGQFASDIGGVLGLWLGWSIMTVFEFIELLLDLVILLCYKARMKLGSASSSLVSSRMALREARRRAQDEIDNRKQPISDEENVEEITRQAPPIRRIRPMTDEEWTSAVHGESTERISSADSESELRRNLRIKPRKVHPHHWHDENILKYV